MGQRSLRKLTQDEYLALENLMENVPNPDDLYTATGWHYELAGLLHKFGFRPMGRYDAYELAVKLLELGYEN